jgi:hypothetical protein
MNCEAKNTDMSALERGGEMTMATSKHITREQADARYPGAMADFPLAWHEAWVLYWTFPDLRSREPDGLFASNKDDILLWHDDGRGWRRL